MSVISAQVRHPLNPVNTIMLWCTGGFRWSLIGSPWCRETPVFRTAISLSESFYSFFFLSLSDSVFTLSEAGPSRCHGSSIEDPLKTPQEHRSNNNNNTAFETTRPETPRTSRQSCLKWYSELYLRGVASQKSCSRASGHKNVPIWDALLNTLEHETFFYRKKLFSLSHRISL